MLNITLKEGEFATIGGAIIRIGRWSRHQMRLQIVAPIEMNVLRFDASGNLETKRRRVLSRKRVGVGETASCVELTLRCGHTMQVAPGQGEVDSIECEHCAREGAELYARILALAAATAEDNGD